MPDKVAMCAWHRDMFRDQVPVPYYAGNFRRLDKLKPCLCGDVSVAGVHGSPPEQVEAHMAELFVLIANEIAAIESDSTTPDDEKALMIADAVGTAVGRFVHIHPFVNGNGRTSRMLWRVLLYRLKFHDPRLSVLHHPHGDYDAVMGAAMQGDYAPAVALVLVGLARGPKGPPVATATPMMLPAPAQPAQHQAAAQAVAPADNAADGE